MSTGESMYSGPRISHLRKGWASVAFQFQKPHFWNEDTNPPAACVRIEDGSPVRYYNSLCGLVAVTTDKNPAFGAGNFPVCKKCLKKARTPPDAHDRLSFIEAPSR